MEMVFISPAEPVAAEPHQCVPQSAYKLDLQGIPMNMYIE